MMSRRTMLLAVPALLAACRSPEPLYFTLAAVRGTPAPGAPKTIELRRPGLAGYLDRSDIVRGNTGYKLDLASNERWGEPLGDMFGRVLAEDLTQRLPGSSVFTEAGSISADPDALVELDVQRFDAGAGDQLILLVQVAIERGRGHSPVASRSIRLTQTPANAATASLVAAMSGLLGQLADQLAGMLREV